MATRVGRPLVDGIDAGVVRPATLANEETAAVRTSDAERLIGDRPVRWWTLAGTWLAMAFSVAFGLYVNYEAQGLEVTFIDTLMAMIPHYLFWVLVSPPLYRSLHKMIQGPNRVLWTSMLAAWSGIALTGSTAMSYFSYI
ncbi:MAG TPA: hypothetical protein VIG03_10565, partial [Steroidobacteraceae bacterium]